MKIVVQRVNNASVTVEGEKLSEIGRGMLVFLGIAEGDTEEKAKKLADKLSKLRIFADENGKTNLASDDIGGEILIISQFTLYADCRKGNRPSFTGAAAPARAEELYEYFIKICETKFKKAGHGSFGADMKVSLENDGPFTLVLEL